MCYHNEQQITRKPLFKPIYRMLLKALIVRSTTQKGKKPFRSRVCQLADGLCEPGRWLIYHLHGTDRLIALATGRDVAHGQGGNQGKYLVL